MSATRTATETRVRLGSVIDSDQATIEPATIEQEQEPLAILDESDRLDGLDTMPAEELQKRIRDVRALIAKALNGTPVPDPYELIDGGRENVD